MIDLTDINVVKAIQGNVRATFGSPQGQEVLRFLEEAVGYDASIFDPTNRDMCLINDGKRQVVATIKTFIKLSPEAIMQLAKQKEQ